MSLVVTKIYFDDISEELKIEGEMDSYINPIIVIRQRFNTLDLIIPRKFSIIPEIEGNNFIFKINFNQYSYILHQAQIWDFIICEGEEVRPLYIPKGSIIKSDCFKLSETIYQVKPYITTDNKLALWVKVCENIKADIIKYNNIDEGILLELSIKNLPTDINSDAIKICFRKKESKKNELYGKELQFDVSEFEKDSYRFNIKYNDLITDKIINEQSWICFLKFISKENKNTFLNYNIINVDLVKDFIINKYEDSLYEKKIVINKSRKIELSIKNKQEFIYLDKIINISEREIEISGIYSNENENILISKIYLKKRILNSENIYDYGNKEVDFIDKKGWFSAVIKFDTIFITSNMQDDDIFDIFVELSNIKTEEKCIYRISTKNINEINYNYECLEKANYSIKPYRTLIDTLSFYIKKQVFKATQNAIRIAINGSCYSKSAFGSAKYFNPFYKEKYDVVYTQFHSSIPSLISNPIDYDKTYFEGFAKSEKMFIDCDFKKTFFIDLKESKPDYLIMDLYSDAVRDLIVFDDKRILTGTLFLKRASYLDNFGENINIITHDDIDNFLKYWIPAVDIFIKKLKQCIPEDKIILQKARMIDKYYDKNKKIKKFDNYNDVYLINRSNFYFEFMEDYLLDKMPKMKVIDLNNKGYIGCEDFPYGHSTNHYESDYYRDLLTEIDNIILTDMCN